MSVEWLCKRCATKLGKSIEPEPMILRRCTGCDVENYCFPSGHAGEDAEPEKASKIARSQAAVHGKVAGEVSESIPPDGTISREDIETAKEDIREGERIQKVMAIAEKELEAETVEEAPENETMSEDAQRRAAIQKQIDELKSQLSEVE